MRTHREFIEHLPIERRDGGLYAAGVQIRGFAIGHIPARLYVAVDTALGAKAAAEGWNMPVALAPEVWLLECRRCRAPFIALPLAKLCSDACRTAAKRDAVARYRAKRAERAWREPGREDGLFVCDQCGRLREGRSRPTKRFCSVRCRVAAHRGVRPQPPDAEALDHQIGQIEAALPGLGMIKGGLDIALGLGRRLSALKAERAKLDATSTSPLS
jgi:hypothetical protein